jgi:hypothetical protein
MDYWRKKGSGQNRSLQPRYAGSLQASNNRGSRAITYFALFLPVSTTMDLSLLIDL